MTVTQDATSGWYLPANASEWTELLSGTGIPVPTSAYNLDEASSPFVDMFGVDNLTSVTIAGFQQSYSGWSRIGFTTTDGSAHYAATASTLTSASRTVLAFVGVSAASATRMAAYLGNFACVEVTTGDVYGAGSLAGPNFGAANAGSTVHPLIYKVDDTAVVNKLYTDQESVTGNSLSADANSIFLGCPFGGIGAPGAWFGYAAIWTGTDAELSDDDVATLLDRLQNGVPVAADTTTLAAMQAGSMSQKLVVLIEGCKYVLSDAPEFAVQTALAGTDWEDSTVIQGLYVQCKPSQSITPWNPLTNNDSKCTLRIADYDGSDTFGKFVNKRAAGAETQLSASVGRDDTT